jgi:tetratricopeptide (TPR) repeat protein
MIARIISSSTLCHCLLITALGFLLYANTLKVPFLFDDLPSISNNKAIATYFDTSIPAAEKYANLLPDVINSMDARKVVYFTFALNYLIHGLDVTGYHIVNMLIHLAAALTVYALLSTLLKTPFFSDNPVSHSVRRGLPLLTALLFVIHPIQTSAVTYVIQRFTSLATLFYLLSITMYLKARISNTVRYQVVFLTASLALAIIGMFSKEIVFTLPVIALVCEFMFFKGRSGQRILFLLPLFSTMLIIPLNMMSQIDATANIKDVLDNSINLANLDNVSQKDYFLTQLRVIVTYIRLLLLPVNQHLLYDYPKYHSIFNPSVALSALFLAGIVLAAFWSYRRSCTASPAAWPLRLFSFGIFWFFITISMSSSLIPLSDMIFEYRLYLPSTGFFIAVPAIVILFLQKVELAEFRIAMILPASILIILLSFCAQTVVRNYIWGDPIRFWEDNVTKAPQKVSPREHLAMQYYSAGKMEEHINQAIILSTVSPNDFKLWNNIAVNLVKLGRYSEALAAIERALILHPGDQRLLLTYDWILGYVPEKIVQSK